MVTFPTVATWGAAPPFSADIVLQGSLPDPKQRGKPGHIWIEIGDRRTAFASTVRPAGGKSRR